MKKIRFSPRFLDLLLPLILLNLFGGITSITTTEITTTSTTTSDPTITSYSTPDTTTTSTSIPITTSTSDSDPTTISSTTSDPTTTSSATSDPTTTSSATSDPTTTSSATSDPSTTSTSSTSDPTTTSSITSDTTTTSFSTSDTTTTSTTMSDQITTSTTTSDTPTTSASLSESTTTSTSTSVPTTTSTSTSDSTTTSTSTSDPTSTFSTKSDPTTTSSTTSDSTTISSTTSDPTTTFSTTSDPTKTSTTTSDTTTSSTSTSDPTITSSTTSDPMTTSSTTSDQMTTSCTTSDPITISSTTSTLSDQTTTSTPMSDTTTTSTSMSDPTTTSFTTSDPTTTSFTTSDPTTTSSATSDSTTTFSTTSDPMTTSSTTSDPTTTTSSTKSDSTTTSVITPVTTIIFNTTSYSATTSTTTSDLTTASSTTSDQTATSSSTSDSTTRSSTTSDATTASSTTSDSTATFSPTADSTTSSSTTSDRTTSPSKPSDTTTIFTTTSDPPTPSSTRSDPTATPSSTSNSTTSSSNTSDPTTTSSTTSDTTTIFTTTSDPTTASSTTSDPTTTSSSTSDTTSTSTSDSTATSSTTSDMTTTPSTSNTSPTSSSTSNPTTTSWTMSDLTSTSSTTSDPTTTSSSTSVPTTISSSTSATTTTSTTTSDPTTASSTTSYSTTTSTTMSDPTRASSTTSDPTTTSVSTSDTTSTSTSTSDSRATSSTTSDTTTTPSTTPDTTTTPSTTSDTSQTSSSTSHPTTTSSTMSDPTSTSSTTSDPTSTSSTESDPTTNSSSTSVPATMSSSTPDTTTTSSSTSDPTTTSTTTTNPTTISTTTSDSTTISSSTSDPTTISTTTSDPTTISSSTSDPTTISTTTSDPTTTSSTTSDPTTTSSTTSDSTTISSTTDFTTFAFSTTDQTNYDPGTVSVVVSQFYRNNQHVIAFRCDFTTTDNALYDVEWYISGRLFTSQVGMSASAAASYEVATDMFSNITSNLFSFEVEFYCTVTVSTGSGSPAWSTVQSPSFKTFEVSETVMTFSRGEEKSFTVTMNIPFGCSPGQSACSLQFKFYDPDDGYYGFDSSIAIRSSTGGIPTISGITQGSTDLTVTSTVLNIMISAIHNSRYRLRSSFSLRMKTSVVWGAHSMWTTEFSTTFLITVTDSGSLRRRVCYAFVDPHMGTFDGIRYENQNEGEFVLFRSTIRPIEIQMVTKNCGWRWSTAFCPCALTFRAGGDVFTIDHCSGHTTGFLSSRDGILTVYRMYSTSYLIYFPTGLKVYVFLMPYFYYFMNIMIYPTPYEIGKAEGLCGNFNYDRSDDFQIRGTNTFITSYSYRNPPNEFSMSWDMTDNAYSDESLRLSSTYENVATWNTSLTKCIFPYERYGQSGSAICSINENNLRSYFYYRYFIISSRYRGKRDVSIGYHEKREPKFWPSAERSERKRRSSVSLEDAWQICHDELAVNCSAYALRENVTDLADVNQTLNNCALDVMLDGSSSWVEPHCDSFTQTLVITVEQDTEFSENNTDLAATIESQKCPNNCNGHGSCVNGSCVCDTGYGTDLCLVNINEPPTIENILDGDYCDLLGGQSCESILLVSNGFLENVTCGVVIYQVFLEKKISPYPTVWIQEQTACSVQSDLDLHCLQRVSESCLATKRLIQIIQRTSFTVACEYENFNEAYAPTSSSQTATDSFGQRIGLTASNNGVNFSDSKYVVVLDSTCQEIGNDSNGDTILLLKSGYCYIDGVCYASGSVNPSRTCELCMPDEDLFNWYSLCKPESSTDKEITSVITIVAPLAGTLLGVLLALVVVRLCCVTKQRPRIGHAQETVEEIHSETSYANATTLYELDEAVPVTSVMERPMKTQLNYSNMHLDQ